MNRSLWKTRQGINNPWLLIEWHSDNLTLSWV